MRVLCVVGVAVVRLQLKVQVIAFWLFSPYLYNVTCVCCFLRLLANDDDDDD